MAVPQPVSPGALAAPAERAVRVAARITSPPAVASGSHLGGFASGLRFVYADAMHFTWWVGPLAEGAEGAFSSAFSRAFEVGG